jgi:hypothetical protein
MSTQQMARDRGLTMVDSNLGVSSKLAPGTDPDAPGAKALTYFLRYQFSLVRSGTEEVVTYPEKVIPTPLWKAVELQQDRQGRIISLEEAQPMLDAQNTQALAEARLARQEADRVIEGLKAQNPNLGETSDDRVAELESQLKQQGAMLTEMMALLKGKDSQ